VTGSLPSDSARRRRVRDEQQTFEQGPPIEAHAANLLGAVALAVGDRITEATAEAAGGSRSAAASLSALDQFLNGPSIDVLARVLGLKVMFAEGPGRTPERLPSG
jgi:hypothetical protein